MLMSFLQTKSLVWNKISARKKENNVRSRKNIEIFYSDCDERKFIRAHITRKMSKYYAMEDD